MNSEIHNKLLGIFFLVQGGLGIVTGITVVAIFTGMGAYMTLGMPKQQAEYVATMLLVAGSISSIVIAAMAFVTIVAGWKVLKVSQSGRILGIVASMLCLPSFPLGSALGVYGLWFFLSEPGKQLYEGASPGSLPPPPQNSWQ